MLRFYSSILIAMAVLVGCKNFKPYHNLTGRYNAYYNAGLRITGAFETLQQSHQDNYNKLLPMYPYIIADAGGVKTPLDEAITKCAKNIELHRISNWVDDSYLYLGQAEFLKKEYDKSALTFKYIVDKFNPDKPKSAMDKSELEALKEKNKKKNNKKKKKKKKSNKKKKKPTPKDKDKDKDKKPDETDDPADAKPKKYGLKHRPNRHEAMLWLAKAYIENKQQDDARLYLRLLENDKDVPARLRGEIQAVMAHSFLTQKEYVKAIEPLELAIERTRKKRVKNRYVYILAQLYQQQGNNAMAMERFRDVLKLRPDYTMEFNARLNMAKNAANVKGGTEINPEMAIKRMLRDGKNEEYKDQLYFALAEIQLKSGNVEEGIQSLQKSMARAQGPQRAEASLLLGDLYFDKGAYVQAFNYYDTASTSLAKEDERTEHIQMRHAQLKPIATNIQTIELQDSLLKVGSWAFEDQKEWAQRMRKEELEAKKANTGTTTGSGKNGKASMAKGDEVRTAVDGGGVSQNAINQSKFELYEPTLRKKGERDFEKRWGDRAWGDNWRSSNEENTNGNTDVAKSGELQPMTEEEVKKFLQNKKIPTTDTDRKQAIEALSAAYFKLGIAYRENLQRNDLAIQTFETLVNKYPDSKEALEAMFMLHNIFLEQGNVAQAEAYKKRILEKHAQSDIAKSLQDPNFVGAKQQQIAALNKYYEEVRKMVEKRQFVEAKEKIRAVPTKFTDNPLKARFAILEAMCVGGTEGQDPYVKALKAVSTAFPKTPEDEQAKKMVVALVGSKPDQTFTTGGNSGTPSTTKEGNTTFDQTAEIGHYVIILFDDKKAKAENFKDKISDFNIRHYNLAKYSVSPLLIDRELPALVVRKFKNQQQAKEYMEHAYNSTVLGAEAPKHQFYYIGQKNYQAVLQSNNFRSEYATFFTEVLHK